MRRANVTNVGAFRALVRELVDGAHPPVRSTVLLKFAVFSSDPDLVRDNVGAAIAEWGSEEASDELFDITCDYENEAGPDVVSTMRALCCHPIFNFSEKLQHAGHVAGNNDDGAAWVRELCAAPEAAPLVDVALWAASRAGLVDVVRACLARGGDPLATVTGWSLSNDFALVDAGRCGRRTVVEEIARWDSARGKRGEDGVVRIRADFLLFAAAGVGAVELAIDALHDGADADFCFDHSDETPKMLAEERGHATMTKLLRITSRESDDYGSASS
jgi:hypothetical protein